MKCYASDYCQKDKSSCSDVCGGYRVLRALYNLSRIPERYRYTIALKPENGEDPVVALAIVDQSIDKGWKDLYPLKNYGRQGKPTAVSKKFSGNTLKDAEGKDIVF